MTRGTHPHPKIETGIRFDDGRLPHVFVLESSVCFSEDGVPGVDGETMLLFGKIVGLVKSAGSFALDSFDNSLEFGGVCIFGCFEPVLNTSVLRVGKLFTRREQRVSRGGGLGDFILPWDSAGGIIWLCTRLLICAIRVSICTPEQKTKTCLGKARSQAVRPASAPSRLLWPSCGTSTFQYSSGW